MARFLFVVPPLTGHVNPTVSVAHELRGRGHTVAWAGDRGLIGSLLPEGAELISVGTELSTDIVDEMHAKARGLRGPKALKFLWEEFIVPLGDHTVEGLDDAVSTFDPTVLVVDQQAIAGGVVAERRSLPWATSATTSAEFTDPLDGLPLIDDWIVGQIREFQIRHGVDADRAAATDLRFSPHLVIGFTSEALVGPVSSFPGHYVFVGPSIDDRPEQAEFPWEWLDDSRRKVLVSLGTVNRDIGDRFYAATIDAFGGRDDLQVVLVAPGERFADGAPANILVRDFVPQLALLPELDAVVGHGGHNTTCEALANGLPLVLAPIRDDQPIVADQVVRAGAGVRVKFGRVNAQQLADAVDSVLDEPSYRAAASRVQASFEAAGGAATAADYLEKLA